LRGNSFPDRVQVIEKLQRAPIGTARIVEQKDGRNENARECNPGSTPSRQDRLDAELSRLSCVYHRLKSRGWVL
jgi:hypothetical protein